MYKILCSTLTLFLVLITANAFATEPLHDQFIYENQKGYIFPSKCCWIKKPFSEKLTELIRAEHCSAIGGPVSQIKFEEGKLWLTGLYRCGGNIPLNEVYPDFAKRELAVWLSGTYQAKLDRLCRNKKWQFVFKRELTLVVEKGVVKSVTQEMYDKSTCK